MSAVPLLCLLGVGLAVAAIVLGYVAIGVAGLVGFPLLAWYDWRSFGDPPDGAHWWHRLGPRPSGGSGGSRVPARVGPGPAQPARGQARSLTDDD